MLHTKPQIAHQKHSGVIMGDPKPCHDCKGAKLRLKCLELYGQYEAHHVCLDCESEEAQEVAIRTRFEFTTNYSRGREIA
jgi:hypothetical protein